MIPPQTTSLDDGRLARLIPLRWWNRPGEARVAFLEHQNPWTTLGYGAGWLGRYLAQRDSALNRYVIMVGGRCCGVMGVRFPWLVGPFLELMVVAPDAQNLGLGRLAVGSFTDAAAKRFRNAWTSAADFNTGARRFYERLGFREAGTVPGLLADDRDEILYRRRF